MDQYFTIKCPRHPSCLCEIFTTSTSTPYCLLCLECFLEEAISPLSLVKIEDILKAKKVQFLKNWPPLGQKQKEIFQKLNEIQDIQQVNESVRQAVEDFFENVETAIIAALRKKKKETLKSIPFPLNKEQAVEKYLEIAQIEELKNALTSTLDSSKIEYNLKNIIEKQTNNMKINSEKLETLINSIKQQETFNSDRAQLILNQFIQNVSSIEIFSKDTPPRAEKSLLNWDLQIEEESKGKALIAFKWPNDIKQIPIFMKQINEDSLTTCQMKKILQKDKKYILKLQLVNKDFYQTLINLIPINNSQQCISFASFGVLSSRVIKGKDIWSQYYELSSRLTQQKLGQVELRICIQDKYFVVLDSPSYQNAIQESPDKFIPDSDYKIQFQIYGKDDSIIFEEFSEVDQFPVI